MRSAPFGLPPCSSTMSGCWAWTLSSAAQMRGWSLKSMPPVKAMRGPAGTSSSASARRLAARKSRLSIIAEVRARWLTIEPERGRHSEPVTASNRLGGVVAAELEGVAPLDQADALRGQALQLDRADLGAVLLELARRCACSLASSSRSMRLDLAVEQIDEGPEQVVEIVLEPGVGEQRCEAFDDRAEIGPRRYRPRASAADRARPGRAGGRTAPARRAACAVGEAACCSVSGSVSGKGRGMSCVIMAGAFLPEGSAAPIAAFTAIPGRGRRRGAPRTGRQRSAARMADGELFCFAMQSRRPLARRRKMRGGRHCAAAQGGPVSGRPAALADRRSGRPWARPSVPG